MGILSNIGGETNSRAKRHITETEELKEDTEPKIRKPNSICKLKARQNNTTINGNVEDQSKRDTQRNGMRIWNNACCLVRALQILQEMGLPDQETNPNITPCPEYINMKRNLKTDQKQH